MIAWHLIQDPELRYTDLGADFYDNRINPEHRKRTHIRQLEALGYKVTLEPAACHPGLKPARLRHRSARRCRLSANSPIFGLAEGRRFDPAPDHCRHSEQR